MKEIITIKGKRVIEIYESFEGSYWYVTEKAYKQDSLIDGKVYKDDQIFFGYVRLSACPDCAEFGYFSEAELELLGGKVSKVPRKDWAFCPEVEVSSAVKEACRLGTDRFGEARLGVQSYSSFCKGVDEKMDEDMKEKLNCYLELLDEIKAKTENEQVAVAVFGEIAKDFRMKRMIEEREARNNEPATAKQKKFMDDLGIKYQRNVSKREASALIDEELGRNNNSL